MKLSFASFASFLFIILVCIGVLSAQQEELPPELAKLRTRFSAEVESLNRPLETLSKRYRDYLEKQKTAYKKDGKLEAMLAVDEELKSFENGQEKELSTYPELARLQQIYRQQRIGALGKSDELKLKLVKSFRKNASDLAANWTKGDRIEDAKLALAESKRFAEMEKNLALVDVKPPSKNTGRGLEGTKPGEEVENSIRMKLCWIPAGKFTMGSPEDEAGRNASREAQVTVELTQGFWMGKYEVTQGEYEEVMGSNPAHFKEVGNNAPVERVSWNDAMSFCAKLTELDRKKGKLPKGWKYTLPTEAQWEYACRAGEKGRYSGGDLGEVGWFNKNGGGKTHEVGQKKPNAWGLHEMHGNVFEWCADWYADKLSGGKDPEGAKDGAERATRGGSWLHNANLSRSADRLSIHPDFRSNSRGFRAALVPAGKDQ